MAVSVIRNFIAKQLFKQKGAISNNKAVEFSANALENRLINLGIDPSLIRSEKELNQILGLIKQAEDKAFNQKFGNVLSRSNLDRKGEVFDMTGQKIDPRSKIMGGKQAETEAEILARIEKENKEAAQRIKDRKADEKQFNKDVEEAGGMEEFLNKNPIDDDTGDFAQGGRAGFRSGMGKAFLEFIKKFKVKQSGDDLKDFLSKRKFLKDMAGNTEKNKRARESAMLKEAMEKARKEGGYKFKDIDVDKDIRPIFDQSKDRTINSDGGRAGFRSGLGKRFLEILKGKPKVKFDEKRFREGPIDLDFLKNIDKKDLAPFIRARDTGGIGGYGMYDNFADMPAGLRAAELINTIKTKDGGINYKAAELFLGKKLKGNESANELIQILNRQEMRADGGRIGYKDGPELSDFLNVQASGSKTGKNQIKGAPEGITADSESINAIIKADIPISQKIDLLADFQYGKGRTRIERDNQEIFLDEGGFKSRNVGLGFNRDGEGLSGSIMHNLETGDDDFKIRFIKKFADGGRIGLKDGMDRRTFLKIMGGLASVPILGKFLKPAKVASKAVKAAPVVSKTTPPAYFFELAETIKKSGKVFDGPQERLKIHTKPSKDGKSELMLTEDLGTGEMQIKKISKEGDDMVTEVQTMEYTPGMSQADETTQGIPSSSYDEYTEFNSRIIKDEFNEPDVVDGIKVDEIIEEVKDAPSIKRAGGGIARMLGE